jgi:hypothetical protein
MIVLIKAVIVMIMVILFIIALSACSSRSGQLNNTKPEKVVVLNTTRYLTKQTYKGNVRTTPMYSIKVKRISQGVVTFITSQYVYSVGDTLLYKFPQ